MAFEIEIKAWLDDPEGVGEKLCAIGSFVRSYEKADSYWLPAGEGPPGASVPGSGVRVRRERGVGRDGEERGSAFVTVKKKRVSDGMEVNEEREFSVSDAGLFEELAGELGLFKATHKEKAGREWSVPAKAEGGQPVKAEISKVRYLGWFLELELLAEDGGEKTVEESRGELFALLDRLGVPRERVEAVSYGSLLLERRKNPDGGRD